MRNGPEHAFAGTFRLNEHEDQLRAAYKDAESGRLPWTAPAELYCHTLTDRSILGSGLALDAPHAHAVRPAHARAPLPRRQRRRPRDDARALPRRLDEHLAEPIRGCLARDADGELCLEARTPLDLEADLGLPGGNIFHGDLEWPWAPSRADAGRWGVETENPRVLICGSGARRGGGVSGVGGHNAAMALLGR